MPPRKRIPIEYTDREKRLLRWSNLSPAYRRRLERAGIGPQNYADRMVPLAKARGHGSSERENAMRRVNRARRRGLPVDSDDAEYGIHARELDTIAKVYGGRREPDYKAAADLIIARAEAQAEYQRLYPGWPFAFRDAEYQTGPRGMTLKSYWLTQPPGAPDRWFWYH